MKINGQEQLSCVVNVLDLGTSTVLVEALDNLPLISDLVVDMNSLYRQYTVPETPYLRQSEFLIDAQVPAGIDQYQRYENCLECALCVSACPITGSDPGSGYIYNWIGVIGIHSITIFTGIYQYGCELAIAG